MSEENDKFKTEWTLHELALSVAERLTRLENDQQEVVLLKDDSLDVWEARDLRKIAEWDWHHMDDEPCPVVHTFGAFTRGDHEELWGGELGWHYRSTVDSLKAGNHEVQWAEETAEQAKEREEWIAQQKAVGDGSEY